jgi:hypothetical protein
LAAPLDRRVALADYLKECPLILAGETTTGDDALWTLEGDRPDLRAQAWLRYANTVARKNPEPALDRVRAYLAELRAKDVDKAALDVAIAGDPQNPWLYLLRAEWHYRANEGDLMADDLERGSDLLAIDSGTLSVQLVLFHRSSK